MRCQRQADLNYGINVAYKLVPYPYRNISCQRTAQTVVSVRVASAALSSIVYKRFTSQLGKAGTRQSLGARLDVAFHCASYVDRHVHSAHVLSHTHTHARTHAHAP